jgi:hypothetical protein
MKRLITAAALAASTCNAFAGADVLSVEDRMAEMQSQIDLLNKRIELDTVRRTAAGSNARALPTVLSVSIVGNTRKVHLQLPSGAKDHFGVGDQIQNNVTVASVERRKVVVLMRDGKRSVPVALDFADVPVAGQMGVNAIPNPNRQQDQIPASLLPMPPVVQIPSMSHIQGAGAPSATPAATPTTVLPQAPKK